MGSSSVQIPSPPAAKDGSGWRPEAGGGPFGPPTSNSPRSQTIGGRADGARVCGEGDDVGVRALAVIAVGAALAAASLGGGASTASRGAPARARAAGVRLSPSGLPYGTASADVVQRQPPEGSCHAVGSGLYALPDPRCTPGAVDPAVTQATIGETICRPGWTGTVRPPESVSEPEKYASMAAYGVAGPASRYEYDHLVPLELGGAANDPRNLWPELDFSRPEGYDELNPKDALEYALRDRVCDGRMTLAAAQRAIARDWVAASRRYG